ncbi:hypothetical protein APSETT444_003134 [Aspergillus pseudonomiae]
MDRLPIEILLRIFSYLQPKLGSVLRVNSQWFNCGISLIWREAFWFHLSRIPKDRRILYAAAIGKLFLWEGATEEIEEFSHFAYPRLKHLSIGSNPSAKVDIAWLKRYMHARVQSIEFTGDFDPELLLHLQRNCRQLNEISISTPGDRLTGEIFHRFLQNSPVTKVSLDGNNVKSLFAHVILNHLTNHDNLEELSLGYTIDKLPNNIKSLETVRSLRKLSATITHDIFPSFISAFTSLHELNLSVEGEPKSRLTSIDLKHLSNLTQLRSLYISLNGKMDLQKGDLLFLKNLKHLTKLQLTGKMQTAFIAAGFNNVDFEDLVADLPNLRVLTLHLFQLALNIHSLAALGQSCPLLECCDLMGSFNIAQLKEYQAPLFPKLLSLRIQCFNRQTIDRTGAILPVGRGIGPEKYVMQLEAHFPKLQDITLTNSNFMDVAHSEVMFSDSVLHGWRARQHEREQSVLKSYR